ncbi:hypothetical protein [Streptomyces sp. MNU89]|nr:hypothetical protein [Streptomyces sp. MNU89]
MRIEADQLSPVVLGSFTGESSPLEEKPLRVVHVHIWIVDVDAHL